MRNDWALVDSINVMAAAPAWSRAAVAAAVGEWMVRRNPELDAILLSQEATRRLYIVALGSTSARQCTESIAALWRCPVVLVAMDNDETGAKAARTWLEMVPGSFQTLTPGSKDLTETHLVGLDLNIWLSASIELFVETLTKEENDDV